MFADLVLESLTKIMNGHSDALLGLLCGREDCWQRVPQVCRHGVFWPGVRMLVGRGGLGTLHLRAERANRNAAAAAKFLSEQPGIEAVYIPAWRHILTMRSPRNNLAIGLGNGRLTLKGARRRRSGSSPRLNKFHFVLRWENYTTLSHPESTAIG